MSEMTELQRTTQDPKPHELQCMEVWGGSSRAAHVASVPGLRISVHAHPIDEQGGDLYLISSCSSGWITRMLLADVAGHGDEVSDLAHKLRGAMHRSINTVDQSKIARELNRAFESISRDGRFATALLLTYYAQHEYLVLVNAGHPPPLIKRADDPAWSPITSDSDEVRAQTTREIRVGLKNLPLGVIGDTSYEQIAFPIRAGDRICLHTDAYSESLGLNGKQLGTKGLVRLLSHDRLAGCSIDEFNGTLGSIMDSEQITPARDDHTMLIVERTRQPRPPLSIPIVSNWLKSNFGLGHTDTHPA